jgi:ABC-2 type transport system ATP-binding protein
MPAIRAQALTRRFGDRTAVDALGIEVAEGEALGFLGPNGAGKTTTVRMLAGLISPTSGDAEVAGVPVGKDGEALRRRVGVLTESPGLYDRLSVRRNLAYFAALHDLKDADARIEKYLNLVGLWDRREDTAGSLSKGMRQKVAIARSLLHEPPVLFLDEPTSGLDPESARLVRDAIADLKRSGVTIWLCTHNLSEAERLCDRIAIFRTRLLAVDTARGLRTKLFGRRVAIRVNDPAAGQRALADGTPAATGKIRVEESRLLVDVDDPDAAAPGLVRALVAANVDVFEVKDVSGTLEEAYLQLVKDPS